MDFRVDRASFCAAVFLLSAAPTASAGVLFVSPLGRDTNSGSRAAPMRTVGAALKKVGRGQGIRVAPGQYPLAQDSRARALETVVRAAGTPAPKLAGLRLTGSQGLRFEGFEITDSVKIGDHPTLKLKQPSARITLRGNDVHVPDAASDYCVVIRNGANTVRVEQNRIHDCLSGVVGPGRAPASRRIAITENSITDLHGDAIQFGDWSDVVVTDNHLANMRDPLEKIHSDALQITGNAKNVLIARNKMFDSFGQLLLMQPNTGPVEGVRVESNVFAGARGYAIQSSGINRASFVNNTIHDSGYGGLLVRPGLVTGGTNDTIVVNNVAPAITFLPGATPSYSSNNLIVCDPAAPRRPAPGIGTACVADPGFVDPAARDFNLRADSSLRGAGAVLSGVLSLTDANGRPRAAVPAVGAFE